MKLKIAFVCVHNSCRSQMAESISKIYYSSIFDSYSAGTNLVNNTDNNAVATIKHLYKYDNIDNQKPKLIKDIPKMDIIITMGCDVTCPVLDYKYTEDWNLSNPIGKDIKEFEKTALLIEEKMKILVDNIKNNKIDLGDKL